MKKTTILFLGLALISLNSFAQTEEFNDFLSKSNSAQLAEEAVYNDLQREDNGFLSKVEDMQKSIRLMQLELKEKELLYKVEEQDKKLQDLLNPVKEVSEPVRAIPQYPASLGRLVSPVQTFEPVATVSSVSKEDTSKAEVVKDSPLYVTSIKGMGANLVAVIESSDVGVNMVSIGDTINNGYLVKNISKNTVTFEKTNGDIEVIGLSFRK